MTYWLLLIPVASAIVGWMINCAACNAYLSKLSRQGKQTIAHRLVSVMKDLPVSVSLEKHVTDPQNLDHIMPEIESHIDQFLRVKLPQSMPVVGMFVGEKTITQMKEVFLEELKTLFPVIMSSYARRIGENMDMDLLIRQQIGTLSESQLRRSLSHMFQHEITLFARLGAVTGLCIGLLHAALTILLRC